MSGHPEETMRRNDEIHSARLAVLRASMSALSTSGRLRCSVNFRATMASSLAGEPRLQGRGDGIGGCLLELARSGTRLSL